MSRLFIQVYLNMQRGKQTVMSSSHLVTTSGNVRRPCLPRPSCEVRVFFWWPCPASKTKTCQSKVTPDALGPSSSNHDLKPWPNVFTSRCKSQNVVNFTHIQLTCDHLVSTCVGWPNGEKFASTCVRICARPKSTQVGGQGETQVERKWKTCVDLRVRLARDWI